MFFFIHLSSDRVCIFTDCLGSFWFKYNSFSSKVIHNKYNRFVLYKKIKFNLYLNKILNCVFINYSFGVNFESLYNYTFCCLTYVMHWIKCLDK